MDDASAPASLTLADARAVIPLSCYERDPRRFVRAVAVDTAGLFATLVALAVVRPWWFVLPLELVAGGFVAGLFVLGHDASHGAAVSNPATGRRIGALLMLPSWHIERAWDLGHNRIHHGYTARQGMDFVWEPATPESYRAMTRARRLVHRVEWSCAGAGLYYGRTVWWSRMMRVRPTGRDALAWRADRRRVLGYAATVSALAVALGVVMTGTFLGAALMWGKLVAGPVLVFMQLIGWTVYVHHIGRDIPWSTREEWTRWRAQMESTTVLRMPAAIQVVLHNIFVHVPHHVDPRIPWHHLPAAADALTGAFPGVVVDRRFRVRDYFATTRACKVYDYERHQWIAYGAVAGAES